LRMIKEKYRLLLLLTDSYPHPFPANIICSKILSMKSLKENWVLLIAIFVVALIACILANFLVKYRPVDATGKVAGGGGFKASLSLGDKKKNRGAGVNAPTA
jgi:hypothetical protein